MPIELFKASPNTIKDGRDEWISDPCKTDFAKLTLNELFHYKRHKRKFPDPGIMDYCKESSKALKLYKSWMDWQGTFVLKITEKQRQQMLPGPKATRKSTILPLPCEAMINLGEFYQYDIIQTFCLIAKVLFEIHFKKFIWNDISNLISVSKSELYLACLESKELADYIKVKKNQDTVRKYIKQAFRKYKIKTAEIEASADPHLVTYYRGLHPRAGSARMILMTFDEVVDSFGWFGDIISEKATAGNIHIKGAWITSTTISVPRVRKNVNRSYIPVLQEFTYENKISRVLGILNNDLAAILDSPEADKFRQDVIGISSEHLELSKLNEGHKIKDKTFLKGRHKVRTKVLDLIANIKHSEILDQLEENSRSSKPGNLDRHTFSRIIALKENLDQDEWNHLSCIILDVDDFTKISDLYPGHVAPRVLSIIDSKISNVLENNKAGKFRKAYKYNYDNVRRDKYFILVTLRRDAALTLANKICKEISAQDWSLLARELRVTCSGGVDEWRVNAEDFKECIVRATAGLDKAKFTRKNSVHKGVELPDRHLRMQKVKVAILGFLFSLKLLISFISFHFTSDVLHL